MLTLLVFGSFWFWALLATAFVLLIWATETGSGIWATVTMVGTVALLYYLGNDTHIKELVQYLLQNPLHLIGYAMGYFLAGTVWSVLKWYFFLVKKRDYYVESGETPRIPKVNDYKSLFMIWMVYWPFSGIWTIIDSPVKKLFSFIFRHMKSSMQKMADKVFAPLMQLEQKKKEARDAEDAARLKALADKESNKITKNPPHHEN